MVLWRNYGKSEIMEKDRPTSGWKKDIDRRGKLWRV